VGTLGIIGDEVPSARLGHAYQEKATHDGRDRRAKPVRPCELCRPEAPVAREPQNPDRGWAVGGGHLRASDADRERVIDALKTAFVQGRLSKGELARRAGQALQSRTYADLAGATAGIPAEPAAPAPPRQPAPAPQRPAAPAAPAAPAVRARAVNWKVIAWVVGVIIVTPALGVAFFATYYGSFYILLLLGFVASGLIGKAGAGRHSVF
jgi:Domain of unknown function (DUF1707)